eukprot:13154531-Alexandrium_andersonii.AAC.1
MEEALRYCHEGEWQPRGGPFGPPHLRVQWAHMKVLPPPPWMLVDPDDPHEDDLVATGDPLSAVV